MGITSRGTIRVRQVQVPARGASVRVKVVSLARRDGYSRKCQTLRGPAEVELPGLDIKLIILAGEAEVVWDAPRSVVIGDVLAVEIEG